MTNIQLCCMSVVTLLTTSSSSFQSVGGGVARRQAAFSISSTIQQSDTPDTGSSNSVGRRRKSPVEETEHAGLVDLWLDLRGTSLTPEAALELWSLEAGGDGQDCSTAPFSRCLVSPGPSSHNEDVYVERIEGDKTWLYESSGTVAVGTVVNLETDSSRPVLPDPLPLMDALSSDNWVLIDSRGWKKIDEDERVNTVLSLIELISGGSTGSEGGIGLTCHSDSEIVNAMMRIHSLAGSRGMSCVASTESGLLVAGKDETPEHLKFALVLPFDLKLLKTAELLVSR